MVSPRDKVEWALWPTSPTMKSLLPLLSLSLLVSPLFGQTVVLSEDFNAGQVPPSGWTEDNNGNSSGWQPYYDQARHDDYTGWNDNSLVTGGLDMTGLTGMHVVFDQNNVYPSWTDRNGVEVSSNGGGSWSEVWYQDSGATSGYSTEDVSLGAYDGTAGVQLRWRFQGDYANEWTIDNVLVEDGSGGGGGGGGGAYSIEGLVADGLASLVVEGAGAGNLVVVAYSVTGPGPTSTPFGDVDMSPPIMQLPGATAGLDGNANILAFVPPGISGLTVYTQAGIVTASGVPLTNSLIEVVQ